MTIWETVRSREERLLASELQTWKANGRMCDYPDTHNYSVRLRHLDLLLPLYLDPESAYSGSPELLPDLEEAAQGLLDTQLASGCVSLMDCNIDSPPDTAFAVHRVALQYEAISRLGDDRLRTTGEALRQFMSRAAPCLLEGGVHTPNHRWVMCGALARMEAVFGGQAFRERAFAYLSEGFDLTAYGEWTERSNAVYNPVCAIHLYDVAVQFGHAASLEAIRRNLYMMTHMLHPGNAVVTEYSGRQDRARTMPLNARYYIICRLMAHQDRDATMASLAQAAADSGLERADANLLLYRLLYPEALRHPEPASALSESYTVLYGEGNHAAVPQTVPYRGMPAGHPHGAPVLRHREGKLSVTVMAAQPEWLYVQYGQARMTGLKLVAGWFGMGGASFPTIVRVDDRIYRLHVELEGHYRQPLPELHTSGLGGRYVEMPHQLREKSHVSRLELDIEIRLIQGGVEVEWEADGPPHVFLQAVCMFAKEGQLSGSVLPAAQPRLLMWEGGEAVYACGGDCLAVSTPEAGPRHREPVIRGDRLSEDALHLAFNAVTPSKRIIRIRGYEEA
ncbi:hypothetical protein IDH44_15070 [Paenibacillus sp. IB182496]|uniref:Uncharacterized protein n=1 Tax=Paenibacillus sabuli TaxID=2772509 RepID=A0A927BVQ2_9BACL|nr:hypothetical protein [Paenibacillus sabuli]MBD2846520.1 hypothetical protein [Paenibacillus sabuli]